MASQSKNKIKYFPASTFLGLFALLVLVGALGILVYRRLDLIVTTAAAASQPANNRLLNVRDIVSDIYDAENSAILYSLGHEESHLSNYENTKGLLKPKLNSLVSPPPSDTTASRLFATLRQLAEEKIALLDSQLLQQKYNRTDQVLDALSFSLRQSMQPRPLKPSTLPALRADTIAPPHSKDGGPTLLSPEEEKAKVSNFYRWLLGAKPKDVAVHTRVDTSAVVAPIKLPQPKAVTMRTQPILPESIERELDAFKKAEANHYRENLERDLQLATRNQAVSGTMRQVLGEIELHERKVMAATSLQVADIASSANQGIVLFCIGFAFFLLLISIGMWVYFRSIQRHQHAIVAAKAEAENLADARARFLATMSHELRTPMNAILGFSNRLLQTPLQAEQLSQLSIVHRAAKHMHGLANTVLDYSRLDAGQMQYEDADFDLIAEIRLVIDLLQPQFDAKGIALCYQPHAHLPACVIGDPLRLRQILLNLLNNSFKFTEHGSVTLEVIALPYSGTTAKLRFRVRDTGMGIPGERLGAIFNAFEQSDASIGRRFGGAGLGLAITKMLVAQQGGQIGIDSKEGEGTTVWFELPFGVGDASKLHSRETATASIAPLQGKKVLVADDEPFNRRLLQEMLHGWAMECTEATNGQEALDLATQQQFDFILMDLRMPVMDGLEAVKRIRALPNASTTPIFMLSATTQQPEIEAGLATGCAVVLQKPFNETELLQLFLTYMPAARPVAATAEATPVAPQTAPRFSLKGLASMSRQNPRFFRDMVEGFIASAQRCRQEIGLGIQQQDLLQVGDAAHRLAAPAKHLEAQRLYSILKSLEFAGLGDGNWTQIHTSVEDLDQELDHLIPAIQMEMERV